MGRPMTFKGRKPTSSSSSSSSTGESINLLSVRYKLGFRFISKRRLLRKGTAVGSRRSADLAVLDLSRVSDEGVVEDRGSGALAIKACPGGAKLLRVGSDPILGLPLSDLSTVDNRSTKSDISAICSIWV